MKSNEIKTADAVIIIQSCDTSWANVGILHCGAITYRTVAVPSLKHDWHRECLPYTELSMDRFDEILQKNRTVLLETIANLNVSFSRGLHRDGRAGPVRGAAAR